MQFADVACALKTQTAIFIAVKYNSLLHFCKPHEDFFLKSHTLCTQFQSKVHNYRLTFWAISQKSPRHPEGQQGQEWNEISFRTGL